MPYVGQFGKAFAIESGVAAAVSLIVIATLVFALIWRRKSKRRPIGKAERKVLEASYAAFLFVVFGSLAWFSVNANDAEQAQAFDARPAFHIHVTAFQWCWRFTYPTQHVFVEGKCGSNGSIPNFKIPVHTHVELDITSTDVIHEIMFVAQRRNIYAIPGHINALGLTLSHVGTWPGHCSEFCGLYHSWMDFSISAVSKQAFRNWVASQAHTLHAW